MGPWAQIKGPWAQGPWGMGPWAMAPWAHGPGAHGPMGPGPGPRAGAGPGFFDFLWGPGRVIFGSGSKFAARGATRHVIWSRERPNQPIFQNRPNLRQARNTLGNRTRPGVPRNKALGAGKLGPGRREMAQGFFPQGKPALERRGLEPRGLCASEMFWNP